ncbi:MAG: DUF2946 family protein, partial [Alphaproteobacteria bacterium]
MNSLITPHCYVYGANLVPRMLGAVFLSIIVLLAQVFPASASHNFAGSGTWIEICGDGGTYLAQIDEDGNTTPPECDHCAFCLVPVSDLKTLHNDNLVTVMVTEFTLTSYSIDRASLPETPERYWSACRGPPIMSLEN